MLHIHGDMNLMHDVHSTIVGSTFARMLTRNSLSRISALGADGRAYALSLSLWRNGSSSFLVYKTSVINILHRLFT